MEFARRLPQITNPSRLDIIHDAVIKWKHFPRYWPFLRGIHRSPANSPHKGQWRGALTFSLICVWINGWVNNREAGDLRRYRAHYDVSVMYKQGRARPSRCLLIPSTDTIQIAEFVMLLSKSLQQSIIIRKWLDQMTWFKMAGEILRNLTIVQVLISTIR